MRITKLTYSSLKRIPKLRTDFTGNINTLVVTADVIGKVVMLLVDFQLRPVLHIIIMTPEFKPSVYENTFYVSYKIVLRKVSIPSDS